MSEHERSAFRRSVLCFIRRGACRHGELDSGQAEDRRLKARIQSRFREELEVSPEAALLATPYLEAGALGERQQADGTHVAFAAGARVDVLVSWGDA